MRNLLTVLVTVVLSFSAACNSIHEDLSRDFLHPPRQWLVEPADLGLDAETFRIEVGAGSLSGFFIRAPDAAGRTVLLFHDESSNVSTMHPYYRFLVEGGLNVCVFDYRGFGRSDGEPSIRSMVFDMPALLEWLRRRSDVDPDRIAYYGLSWGSVIAIHTAAYQRGCRALLVEDVPSPRDSVRRRIEKRGQDASVLSIGFAEFAGLPERIEPAECAPRLGMPTLWIAGAAQPADRLGATLRAWFEAPDGKQLWVLPDTAAAPHSLLTHDGEYQRVVLRFLRRALDGDLAPVEADWRTAGVDRNGSGNYEVTVRRPDVADGEPWPVQVGVLDAGCRATWRNVWVGDAPERLRVELAGEPGAVSAMHLESVAATDDGGFERLLTPLSRAGSWYERNLDSFDRARRPSMPLAEAQRTAELINARDRLGPMPRRLEAEMADVYAGIGRALAGSTDAETKAAGLVWLERATKAVPAHPERHFWPGKKPTVGFPQEAAVRGARAMLQRLTGG